jgi:tellurite methyltransferase
MQLGYHLMTRWDEKFVAGYGAKGTPEPALIQAVANVHPGHALDLACGLGRNAIYLASQGWKVTAMDSSHVALDALPRMIDGQLVDLESPDFHIEPNTFDLICDCYYLYRDLFPKLREGIKRGGLFVGVIPMIDTDPGIHPMNPAYLLNPGELRSFFADWEILHSNECKPGGDPTRRRVAELIARK